MSDDTLYYSELPPPRQLMPYVRCIWRLRGVPDKGAPPEPIIPDGCAELVLNVGDPFVRHSVDGSHGQPLRLVAGQITRAVTIRPSGVIDLWGVRFHPWGAAPFLRFSGAEMRDRLTSLDDVAGPLARELSDIGGVQSEQVRHDAICSRLTRYVGSAPFCASRRPSNRTTRGLATTRSLTGTSVIAALAPARYFLANSPVCAPTAA